MEGKCQLSLPFMILPAYWLSEHGISWSALRRWRKVKGGQFVVHKRASRSWYHRRIVGDRIVYNRFSGSIEIVEWVEGVPVRLLASQTPQRSTQISHTPKSLRDLCHESPLRIAKLQQCKTACIKDSAQSLWKLDLACFFHKL